MKHHKKIILVFGLIFILFIAGVVFIAYFIQRDFAQRHKNASTIEDNSPIVDSGVSWIKPQVLKDLKLLKIGDGGYQYKEVAYYKVADLSDGGELIWTNAKLDNNGSQDIYRFRKDSNGKYYYLANGSSFGRDFSAVSSYLTTTQVTFDETTVYNSLNPPDYLSVNYNSGSQTLVKTNTQGLFQDWQNPKVVGTSKWGQVFKVLLPNNGKEIGSIDYILKLADSTYEKYYSDFPDKDEKGVPNVIWSGENMNQDYYSHETPFCNKAECYHGNYVLLNIENINQRLKNSGEDFDSNTIYTLTSDDPAMKEFYNNYQQNTVNPMSLDNFVNVKPFFIMKNGFGDYLIFTNEKYAYGDKDTGTY